MSTLWLANSTHMICHVGNKLVELRPGQVSWRCHVLPLVIALTLAIALTYVDKLLVNVHNMRPFLLLYLLDTFGLGDRYDGIGIREGLKKVVAQHEMSGRLQLTKRSR